LFAGRSKRRRNLHLYKCVNGIESFGTVGIEYPGSHTRNQHFYSWRGAITSSTYRLWLCKWSPLPLLQEMAAIAKAVIYPVADFRDVPSVLIDARHGV